MLHQTELLLEAIGISKFNKWPKLSPCRCGSDGLIFPPPPKGIPWFWCPYCQRSTHLFLHLTEDHHFSLEAITQGFFDEKAQNTYFRVAGRLSGIMSQIVDSMDLDNKFLRQGHLWPHKDQHVFTYWEHPCGVPINRFGKLNRPMFLIMGYYYPGYVKEIYVLSAEGNVAYQDLWGDASYQGLVFDKYFNPLRASTIIAPLDLGLYLIAKARYEGYQENLITLIQTDIPISPYSQLLIAPGSKGVATPLCFEPFHTCANRNFKLGFALNFRKLAQELNVRTLLGEAISYRHPAEVMQRWLNRADKEKRQKFYRLVSNSQLSSRWVYQHCGREVWESTGVMHNYGNTKAIVDKNLVILLGDKDISYQTPEENGLLVQGTIDPLYTLGIGDKIYVVFQVISNKFVGVKHLLLKQFTNQLANYLPPGVISSAKIWKQASQTLLAYYNPPHYEVKDFGMQPKGVCIIPGILIQGDKLYYFPTSLLDKVDDFPIPSRFDHTPTPAEKKAAEVFYEAAMYPYLKGKVVQFKVENDYPRWFGGRLWIPKKKSLAKTTLGSSNIKIDLTHVRESVVSQLIIKGIQRSLKEAKCLPTKKALLIVP